MTGINGVDRAFIVVIDLIFHIVYENLELLLSNIRVFRSGKV